MVFSTLFRSPLVAPIASPGVIFNPADIAGISFWVSSDKIAGLTDNDPIGTWADQSVNGYNLTATTTARPTYKTAILNGLPVARFNGSSNVMLTANATSPAVSQPDTIFWVGKFTTDTSALFDSRAQNFTHLVDSYQTNGIRMYANGWAPHSVVCSDQHTAYHVYTFQFNGLNSVLRFNGRLMRTGNAGADSLAGIALGRCSGGGEWLTGDVAEMIVYSGALTPTQQWQVNHYLGVKWGLDTRRWGTLVFHGDSLTASSYASGDAAKYPNVAAGTPPAAGFINAGALGERIDELDTLATTSCDPYVPITTDQNCLVFWGGINDVLQGASAATIESRWQTYIANRRAAGWKKIIGCTLSNQLYNVPPDGERTAFNSWLRANWALYVDGLADIQAAANLQDPNNATYFYTDKIHFIDAGYAEVAGVVRQTINTVLPIG